MSLKRTKRQKKTENSQINVNLDRWRPELRRPDQRKFKWDCFEKKAQNSALIIKSYFANKGNKNCKTRNFKHDALIWAKNQ